MASKILSVILLSAILLFTEVAPQSCPLPPSVWCSSREVAKTCGVEKQCEAYLTPIPKAKAQLVNFTLYLESLCPDCKNFINQQLWPAFKAVGTIMNLALVPYGNAREQQYGDRWQFECQHGKEECYGNLIETCAIYYHPNATAYFPFIYCIESSTSLPRNIASECASKFGFDYSQIQSCVEGPLGNKLEHEMALKTDALQPPHQYVPWVTLNGVHTQQIQNEAQNDLVKLICDTYLGSPKPQACSQKM
ncbi:Hypothetical predicted protein [Paramuricea clavata]|uniref:Uncharacterized protein n=1 Tax=Paramuricea clavata TaxID=317549 RepID=A0A6S7G7J3_PARCT|nr:Hypothetical predicted protein [Paramuricea clavata]